MRFTKPLRFPTLGILALAFAAGAAESPIGEAPSCHPGGAAPPAAAVSCATEPSPASSAPHSAAAPVSAAASGSERSTVVEEGRDPDGGHWRTILFKNFLIDRIYPSMKGPWTRTYLNGNGSPRDGNLWLTRYRAEVLDAKTGSASQEFMCHTNLDVVRSVEGGSYAHLQSQLSISQGQKEIVLPEGFALKIAGARDRAIDVNAMVLNNNDADIHRLLDFKVTITYEDDDGAARRRLVPLFQGAVASSCLTDILSARPGETVCRAASSTADTADSEGRKSTGHWIVPPGRQVISQDVSLPVPEDTTVHYIWMHVHPYAESIELTDLTNARTIFKGKVSNAPNRAAVLATDHYSDPRGIPVFVGHRYALTTVYNNTSGHDVDAMAALWMYFRSKEAPLPSVASK